MLFLEMSSAIVTFAIELLIEYLVHGMMKIHEILDFLIFRIFQNLMILYPKVRNIAHLGTENTLKRRPETKE